MTGKTILLLEDDNNLRALYQFWLEQAGYHVVPRSSSEAIEQIIEQHQPSLLITDMLMPQFDGVGGVFKILGRYRIPIIAISGDAAHLNVLKRVVVACLLKPFTNEQLQEEVKRALGST